MPTQPTILIADDNDAFLAALSIRLTQIGAQVVTARDGYNALAAASKHQPDLIILDVNMPAGDGFSVQQRLQNLQPNDCPPVIYLTGDQSERLDDLAEINGAFALLHKPFDLKDLVETVNRALIPKAA